MMKVNEMLLNQLKMKSRYGENTQTDKQTRQVVNGSVEYWDKSSKATEILERYNVPKTEENKQGIEAFMKNEEGTMTSKLETLEIAASNGVDMTEENLSSIHEALNEDFSLNESIEVLVVSEGDQGEMITTDDIENMELPADMKAKIMQAIEKGETPTKALANAIGQTLGKAFLSKFDGVVEGDITVTIRITIEVIEIRYQQEGENLDLEKLMAQFSALIEGAKNGEGSLLTTAADIIAALENVSLELDTDTNSEAVEDLADSEKAPLTEMKDLDEQIAEWVAEALGSVEQVSMDLTAAFEESPTIKLYVVESVTIKMQDVAEEFKVAQKDMLQTMEKAISEEKPLTTEQVKDVLNSVINKLDDVLLKSDVPLYTSMSMEKNLLKMSSDLQTARQHLAKGNIADAKNIIKTVHGKLEEAVFKPSERKVQGFALKQSEAFLQNKEMIQLQTYRQEGVSARNVLELFRNLGLNHEYEVSEKLSQLKTLEKEMKLDTNLKEVLHKLDQDEKQENKTVETIEKSLNNLNGQQLLNKQGQKNNQQTLFFNIPMVNDQEVKNMKLYVNSRDANNRLDWENCSLYFVIDLKQYGPTGIKVDIKDRGVSITVKNDDEDLKDVIEPLLENLGDMFEDVGLKEKDVNFVPLDNHKKFGRDMLKDKPVIEEVAKSMNTAYTDPKKGFDFKI
jgi:hypothetical protein